jgi:ribonucleoside-diphosphate reductase alpha chain
LSTIDTDHTNKVSDQSYIDYNATLNLWDEDGGIQFDSDKEAARQYFLQHVNPNTFWFHDLEERFRYLLDNEYYERDLVDLYDFEFIKELTKIAYNYKFRFPTFMGAYKYFQQYALKTVDGSKYLERFEDRVVMVALGLAQGNEDDAIGYLHEIITQRYQPATPTFINMGKKRRGEYVSCFLLGTYDNMESITQVISASLQLSKRGGGVGILMSNLREVGAPIKGIEGAASGVVPVMKILEDSFSYANQLGARQGAGAVYLNVHHPDIMRFLDTKRENADEKVRIKTLSLGVVIPDITFELAKKNEDMYLFSPHDVEKEYGKPFSEINVSEEYYNLVNNSKITKSKISARKLFTTIAEIQFESGYPYIMFEDTVNRAHNIDGKVQFSNLCSEILQINTPTVFNEDGTHQTTGRDISCNLGSLNIAKVIDGGNLGKTVHRAIRALTSVSDQSNISVVPTVKTGNDKTHAVGLGQMNLHGFLMREGIEYGSEEALDFVSAYFAAVAYYAVRTSMIIAKEKNETFEGFEKSKYATGEFFTKYIEQSWLPKTKTVQDIFNYYDIELPDVDSWRSLKHEVSEYGMYNAYLQAVAPTGSISYVNNSTSSIHPITSIIEIRKEGKLGRVYYPAPYLTNENKDLYKDAYEIGYEKLIDTYAAATQHVDQGLSLTLFFKDTHTTRDLNKAYIMAWQKGIKTIYYSRIRQAALEGTEQELCVSCTI